MQPLNQRSRYPHTELCTLAACWPTGRWTYGKVSSWKNCWPGRSLSSPLRRRLPNRRYATGSTNASRESERSATLCYFTFISLYLLITADMREHNKITGVWRTGMSTVPAAPPIKYILGYRSRTRTLNPITDPNPNFLFFYSILRWSVAGSTMRRQYSCLPPGQFRKANFLLAKVCLHCTKPGVAGSS